MVKFSSRLLSVVMALVIVAATILPSTSFAAEDTGPQVIKDNNKIRIVKTVEDGVTTVASFDKKKNTLKIKEDGEETIVLDLGELSEEYIADGSISDSSEAPQFGLMASTTKQDTFINYEYTITHSSPEKWQLRRPKGDSLFYYYYKNVTRTSSNASNLDNFQTAVENINYYEWRAIGGSLTSVGLSWLSFILSVPTAGAGTLTAGLAALGAYGATLDALVQLHRHANLASTYYHRV